MPRGQFFPAFEISPVFAGKLESLNVVAFSVVHIRDLKSSADIQNGSGNE